jgi:hypothetical protein
MTKLIHGTVNVKVLSVPKHHTMKVYRKRGSKTPRILHLETRLR